MAVSPTERWVTCRGSDASAPTCFITWAMMSTDAVIKL